MRPIKPLCPLTKEDLAALTKSLEAPARYRAGKVPLAELPRSIRRNLATSIKLIQMARQLLGITITRSELDTLAANNQGPAFFMWKNDRFYLLREALGYLQQHHNGGASSGAPTQNRNVRTED